ncbi:methylthioribose-1-phosphate isomerase [Striga asiatica]|uniref:Methylthioribose-1-phosphate isomerase n=1 Tax=Striga asiatica TaxID=4170 RepID=A0A5A7Q6V6_STRAF|nr:methylthioribose-1-phosphate isomerase [Striga asiatica]
MDSEEISKLCEQLRLDLEEEVVPVAASASDIGFAKLATSLVGKVFGNKHENIPDIGELHSIEVNIKGGQQKGWKRKQGMSNTVQLGKAKVLKSFSTSKATGNSSGILAETNCLSLSISASVSPT